MSKVIREQPTRETSANLLLSISTQRRRTVSSAYRMIEARILKRWALDPNFGSRKLMKSSRTARCPLGKMGRVGKCAILVHVVKSRMRDGVLVRYMGARVGLYKKKVVDKTVAS